eukprot:NODE_1506_length_1478_cov_28.091784_g1428_i0.p1 GENE.NODE_1506_length_1478_cov_28.091784_g1428_i0~~NODE_1506_length_1478_cov_28.091784_g1428_i0.p1  ORF type:complete len:425 (-),score=139.33 NODE_1506_length_1478_cov_28.091784_g1428_i0:102-1376(-)
MAMAMMATGAFDQSYTVGKLLGRGNYGCVYQCVQEATGQQFAVKQVDKVKCPAGVESTWREVGLLKRLQHQHIVEVKAVFETQELLLVVMELLSGGDLFDKIVELKHYTEGVAAQLIANVLAAVQFMHSAHICHRDLKPENIMLKAWVPTTELTPKRRHSFRKMGILFQEEDCDVDALLANVVLVDFGFATAFTPNCAEELTQPCGTVQYMPPEIVQVGVHKTRKGYNEKCDIWSLGVLTYIALCGFPPFIARSQRLLFERIVSRSFGFTQGTIWDTVSDKAKDFVGSLLTVDPAQRPSAEEALRHPWIREALLLQSEEEEEPTDTHAQSIDECISSLRLNRNSIRQMSQPMSPKSMAHLAASPQKYSFNTKQEAEREDSVEECVEGDPISDDEAIQPVDSIIDDGPHSDTPSQEEVREEWMPA